MKVRNQYPAKKKFVFGGLAASIFLTASAYVVKDRAPEPLNTKDVENLYKAAIDPPSQPLSVYFIGHSLVGRDMPALLAQLAGEGHTYESQSGWGAELEAHWEPDIELSGAKFENDHPRFRDAHEAVGSGDYDALVLTEKVEIKDSIRYHKSWFYLSLWAEKAAVANPNIRIFLYETWHNLDDSRGWLSRIDADLKMNWEREIIDRALAADRVDRPIYVIPGGQVMARFTRELEARGGVDGLMSAADLFTDNIHFNSAGAYLIALTHYAVLYGRSPVGLPYNALLDAEGVPITPLGPKAARLMQEVVWEVVTNYKRTGVLKEPT